MDTASVFDKIVNHGNSKMFAEALYALGRNDGYTSRSCTGRYTHTRACNIYVTVRGRKVFVDSEATSEYMISLIPNFDWRKLHDFDHILFIPSPDQKVPPYATGIIVNYFGKAAFVGTANMCDECNHYSFTRLEPTLPFNGCARCESLCAASPGERSTHNVVQESIFNYDSDFPSLSSKN